MAKIYNSVIDLVGRTPLVHLSRLEKELQLDARLLVKAERFNPGGSVKDRVALAMVEDAERSGRLQPGGLIVEPTSGNTGVGLAWVAAVKGYRLILTMPETMTVERRSLLAAYGAEIVLTPGAEGMKGAVARARSIVEEHPGAILAGQFDNPANPEAHTRTTAREIWDDTDGRVDIFVAGVGTGGTISGTARGLKALRPDIRAYAVEPDSSAVLSGEAPGRHAIQGIGAGFVPANYDAAVVDGILRATDADAAATARLLARHEGLLCGISSGAALWAAITLARRPENAGKTIVALLPDTGERYLSTGLFAAE